VAQRPLGLLGVEGRLGLGLGRRRRRAIEQTVQARARQLEQVALHRLDGDRAPVALDQVQRAVGQDLGVEGRLARRRLLGQLLRDGGEGTQDEREGCAREAIRGFPANVNVAVALSLAGVGPDRTEIEIWADPGVDRNTHRIVVDADSAHLEMSIANVPSEENPGSGKITALSLIATLRNLVGPLCF